MRFKKMKWEPYDPTWLIDLVKRQLPKEKWLPDALAKCIRCMRESEAYIFFVNGKKANEPGSQWCFDHNLELNCPNEGWLILDILKDKQIGGLEFVDKIRS
jgi:hypothetical protein